MSDVKRPRLDRAAKRRATARAETAATASSFARVEAVLAALRTGDEGEAAATAGPYACLGCGAAACGWFVCGGSGACRDADVTALQDAGVVAAAAVEAWGAPRVYRFLDAFLERAVRGALRRAAATVAEVRSRVDRGAAGKPCIAAVRLLNLAKPVTKKERRLGVADYYAGWREERERFFAPPWGDSDDDDGLEPCHAIYVLDRLDALRAKRTAAWLRRGDPVGSLPADAWSAVVAAGDARAFAAVAASCRSPPVSTLTSRCTQRRERSRERRWSDVEISCRDDHRSKNQSERP